MVLENGHFSKDPLCYNETFSYISTLHVDLNLIKKSRFQCVFAYKVAPYFILLSFMGFVTC